MLYTNLCIEIMLGNYSLCEVLCMAPTNDLNGKTWMFMLHSTIAETTEL